MEWVNMTDNSSDNFAGIMARARVLSSDLASLADTINTSLGEAEKALKQLNLGVRASIPVRLDDKPVSNKSIAFGKHDGAWRLCLVENETKQEPLTSASREMRMYAAVHLPEIVEAMIKAAESELVRVREGVTNVTTFIESLKAK